MRSTASLAAVTLSLIGADDTFSVTYVDPADATDSADTSGTFRRTASLSITAFSASGYLPGEAASVTVTDRERNLDPLVRDSVAVIVTNPARADTEALVCLETTETSGVFVSTTTLGFEFVGVGVPGDSRLQVLILAVTFRLRPACAFKHYLLLFFFAGPDFSL